MACFTIPEMIVLLGVVVLLAYGGGRWDGDSGSS